MNVAGVKPGSRLLNVFVLLKIAALAVLILGGLFLVGRLGSVQPGPSDVSRPAASLLAFGGALVPILFSYGGWQSANALAEEIREPRRTLPRALFAGTVIVLVCYLLANVFYLAALGRDGLAATTAPAADAARRLFGAGAEKWIAAAIAISSFGFLDLTLLAPTRIYYAMSRDGAFIPALGRLHPRFGTPHRAILLQAGWAVVLVLTGTYGGLVDSVVFADWIFFALTVAASHAAAAPHPARAARTRRLSLPRLSPLSDSLLAASALVLAGVVHSNPVRSGIGVLLLAAGLPVYVAYAGRARAAGSAP